MERKEEKPAGFQAHHGHPRNIQRDQSCNGGKSCCRSCKGPRASRKADNIPLNIGVTGETGAGKSTFINAFRGLKNTDEGAAPVDCTETTMEVQQYPHPNYPNVILWDMPGLGSMTFQANEYLKKVNFEIFDFFVIISADRFREHDMKLALEIQKMNKKFYFVRSKIDHSLRDARDDEKDFNKQRTSE
ncbi:interferon-inducible GTPase 1-like [Thalassophryne amazonica]|uniref:interferon-inducible GTPase 1-like n=1 Tax=Thalassophryne amazonica TaxID=390379 RepID=UPI0014721EEB|nr:interferon-inducible GTPase 1-like [Thalassophryne amazonica]